MMATPRSGNITAPNSACVLDLFVYPEQGQPRVTYAELRSRGPGKANGCLAQILDGKRG